MSLLSKIQKLKEQLTAPSRRRGKDCDCKPQPARKARPEKRNVTIDDEEEEEELAHEIFTFTIQEGRLWTEDRSDNLELLKDLAFKFRSARLDPYKKAHYKHFVPIAKDAWRVYKNIHNLNGRVKEPSPGTFEAAAQMLAHQFRRDVLEE